MPSKAPRPCSNRACNGVTTGRYCDQCNGKRPENITQHDPRPSSAKRGYGYRWQQWRAMYLSRHPFCSDPFSIHNDRAVLATDVHHKTKKRSGGSDKEENLQALCHSCHSRITAKGG